ncbi:MAG: histidinol-phosphate transaminase [Solirubrobacteraceae bacterium]
MDELTRLARPEILAMATYTSLRHEGEPSRPVRLDANESPYLPWLGGVDARDAEGMTLEINRYPEPQPYALLQRFSEHFETSIDSLLITRGADEAIDLLVRAFCIPRRDGIIVCPPTFAMYAIAAQIQDASVSEVPLTAAPHFQLDVDRITATQRRGQGTVARSLFDWRPRRCVVKLVFVCTPNSPTGNLLRREDVLALCSGLRGRALVIADQTYVEYSGEAPLSTEISSHPNLVVLRTLSKEYSLAGERIGITIAHPEVIGVLQRILAPYPLAQSAIALASLTLRPEGVAHARANIGRLLDERRRVKAALEAMPGTRVFPSDANWLLVGVADSTELVRRFETAGIQVRDRSSVCGIEGSVRISIGTGEENDAMLAVVSQHTGFSAS